VAIWNDYDDDKTNLSDVIPPQIIRWNGHMLPYSTSHHNDNAKSHFNVRYCGTFS